MTDFTTTNNLNVQGVTATPPAPPEGEPLHDVVLARPMSLRRDDGSTVNYVAGVNKMPLADKDHWFTQHHLAPDGQPIQMPDAGQMGGGGVDNIIMQRDTAQQAVITLQREVRRVTDLWTESEAKRRASDVELTTLRAAQGNAQRGGPEGADSGKMILQGRLEAANKETSELQVKLAEATKRAEQAEAAVQTLQSQVEQERTYGAVNLARAEELEKQLGNVALAENGGTASQDPPAVSPVLPGTEADPNDEAAAGGGTPAQPVLKVVKYKGKFYVEKDGERSTEGYASHPEAHKAMEELTKGTE